jgi:3-hydroxybutyryl-CoA dehydratase
MSKRELLFDEIEVGHRFSPLIYPVSEELIRKYVDTVGDGNPLHRDTSYAQQMGYGGIIAPPTIAALYVLKAYRTDSMPPEGGVHFRQRFKFYRPIRAGDILHVRAKVVDKYVKKDRKFLVIESLAQNQDGEEVVWSESTSFWAR